MPGQSEPPPGDPAALGRLCQPGPSPGGLRAIRSGPVSGGGLTHRGRLGARRASAAGTGAPFRGASRAGAEPGSLARARCGGSFRADETRRGGVAGVPAAEDRGSRVQRLGAVCLPASRGGEISACATCSSLASTRRLQQVSNLRRGRGGGDDGGPPGSTAGKGVRRQMGEPP